MKEWVFEYKDVISNAEFIIDLLELVLEHSLMEFNGEYFQQMLGIMMGTNVAPIFANLYLAKLEKILKEKTKHDPKLIWPKVFKRYIDDGFGITKGSKKMSNTGFQNSTIWWNLLKQTNSNIQEWNVWIWSFSKAIDSMKKVFLISKYIRKSRIFMLTSCKTHYQKLCAERAQTIHQI